MNPIEFLTETKAEISQVVPATVLRVRPNGTISCACSEDGSRVLCEVLLCSDSPPPRLVPKDEVLVWRSARAGQRGVILGRIGPSRALASAGPADELVLEAKHTVTLKCGEGSITLRGDGKIL